MEEDGPRMSVQNDRRVNKRGDGEGKHAHTQSPLLANLSGLFVPLHGSLPSRSLRPFFGPFNSNRRGQETTLGEKRGR